MSDVSLLVAEEYLENDYFLSEDMDSTSEGKTEKKIKFIKTIFCVLCFALLCELVIYKYVMPSFSSPKVTVTGQKDYTAEEIATTQYNVVVDNKDRIIRINEESHVPERD